MKKDQSSQINDEVKVIVICDNCYQKIRIPRRNRKLHVTCPTCQHKFDYQYYALGLSSRSIRPLLIGLTGGVIGFSVIELFVVNQFLYAPNQVFDVMVIASLYSICLGAVMGIAEGFLKKNWDRLYYGLKTGAVTGLVSGMISGLFAQSVFDAILLPITRGGSAFLWPNTSNLDLSLAQIILARTISWCVFGLLIGLSYGIKEKSWNDLGPGLMGGAIGGAIGGFLFDPLSSSVQVGGGSLARLIGLSILGMAIGVAVFRFRKVVIRRDRNKSKTRRRERVIHYVQLDQGSPNNKTSLQSGSSPKLPPSSGSDPKLPPPTS